MEVNGYVKLRRLGPEHIRPLVEGLNILFTANGAVAVDQGSLEPMLPHGAGQLEAGRFRVLHRHGREGRQTVGVAADVAGQFVIG